MHGFLSEIEIVHAVLCGDVTVTPLVSSDQIGPTIDLRLGTEFSVRRMDSTPHYDPVELHEYHEDDPEQIMRFYEIVKRVDPLDAFWLHPNQFVTGCTIEYVHLPRDIGAQLEGRSSWAREGLNVHSTAGFIHPGHSATVVLELHNAGTHPIALYPGIRVAQLLLYRLHEPVPQGYAERQARYARPVAASIGRPWADWEFQVLLSERRRRAVDGR